MAQLLIGPWENELKKYINISRGNICLMVPFVSGGGAAFLIDLLPIQRVTKIITRLSDADFLSGASEIHALIALRKHGVRIRAQNHRLHAKMYILGDSATVVTSANLTRGGLGRNAEVGVILSDKAEIAVAQSHFNRVWSSLKDDITIHELSQIEAHIMKLQLERDGEQHDPPDIQDRGLEGFIGEREGHIASVRSIHRATESAGQHFCKFLWRRNDEAPIETEISDIAMQQGAIAFPASPGRPRQIQLNDYIYHTALTESDRGRDWIVFARARVASPHRIGKDEVPDNLRKRISVLDQYPYCIWLCDCEFIDGKLRDGVSLRELFEVHGDETFVWSLEEAIDGRPGRHTEAIRYYRSHILLTSAAADTLNSALDERFASHGRITIHSGSDIWWNEHICKLDESRRFVKLP